MNTTQSDLDDDVSTSAHLSFYLPFVVMATTLVVFVCLATVLCRKWCWPCKQIHRQADSPPAPDATDRAVYRSTEPPIEPPVDPAFRNPADPAFKKSVVKPPPYCEHPPQYEELFSVSTFFQTECTRSADVMTHCDDVITENTYSAVARSAKRGSEKPTRKYSHDDVHCFGGESEENVCEADMQPAEVLLTISLCLGLTETRSSQCDTGWEYQSNHLQKDEYYSKCYKYTDIRVDFHTAVNSCEEMGAMLLKIMSDDENTFVFHLAKNGRIQLNGSEAEVDFWIGLSRNLDDGSPGPWSWRDGTGLHFRNWRNKEPQESDGCARIRGSDPKWFGSKCNSSQGQGFVCEKEKRNHYFILILWCVGLITLIIGYITMTVLFLFVLS
ncbi:hypothetical protein CAPTEDRAFT_197807 [Capitella teleta]|uniref:C-type lectin domain-containing protein n=1 Tax=Capitella teleta TaxID=283909 RepID=R7TKK6_CAPTE|nr:hypothetical protein CAPTEDRAFT_197807 [Capitella teleta]|eukprot:ELT94032.1 hypothetical protein CAPTEDRAFT_197807 [Capitella teleta]